MLLRRAELVRHLHVQSVSFWAMATIGPYAQSASVGGVTVTLRLLRLKCFGAFFRTFGGSFSAVWTATIARKDAFFSIFENLDKYATEFVEFCKPSHQLSKYRQNLKICRFSQIFAKFHPTPLFFGANFMDFSRDFT